MLAAEALAFMRRSEAMAVVMRPLAARAHRLDSRRVARLLVAAFEAGSTASELPDLADSACRALVESEDALPSALLPLAEAAAELAAARVYRPDPRSGLELLLQHVSRRAREEPGAFGNPELERFAAAAQRSGCTSALPALQRLQQHAPAEEAGFRDREFILDLISFGTPNHRTRYYLLAERSQASPHLVPSPALSASLEELMPAGVLLRGPWAKERRRRLEEAHAAARQASGREATEEVFRAARRTFCEALAALLPAASAGELVGPTELTLQGSSAWKLLPLPRAESDALLLVFDEDGQAGSRADKLLSRLPHDENVGDLVSWSRWPPQGTKQGSVAARPVADFLEESSLAPDERSELMISLELLSKPFAPGLSYVGQQDVRSFCFTGHYGKVMHKASGSLLHLPSGPGGAPLDRAKPATNHGAVRLFSPKEILNFLGFPAAYSLPKDMELKHRYKVVGNSIAVTVASELLRFLLLREGGERLAALEQPPPERQAALAE
eukprot:TRINITY_DN29122_c0_g1_i2.p1 TRINITY_DN29122_c0_g1~~TRINITY_DN29122_c0_g1_i2.p1  ORF type:complete len:500 (+),score=113.36 TRINITY_DN29122_c0_g1_i2:3-1502(+)